MGTVETSSAAAAVTITVTEVNDIPVLSNFDGGSLAYTDGDGARVVLDTAGVAVVTDPDSADFDGGNIDLCCVECSCGIFGQSCSAHHLDDGYHLFEWQ